MATIPGQCQAACQQCPQGQSAGRHQADMQAGDDQQVTDTELLEQGPQRVIETAAVRHGESAQNGSLRGITYGGDDFPAQ